MRLANPYIRKIDDSSHSENSATLGGIAIKVIFFFILTAIGAWLYFYNIIPSKFITTFLIGSSILTIVTLFLSYFVPASAPISGAIFSLCEGYLIGYSCNMYTNLYSGVIPIAIIVTLAVVGTMLVLYLTRIIRVGRRFRTVFTTLFFGSVVLSVIIFISSFFTNALTDVFLSNGILGISYSIGFVLFSAFYLVIDFDNISIAIDNHCDKKYEWLLAFGLVVTILILFVRVLELVAKIGSNQD